MSSPASVLPPTPIAPEFLFPDDKHHSDKLDTSSILIILFTTGIPFILFTCGFSWCCLDRNGMQRRMKDSKPMQMISRVRGGRERKSLASTYNHTQAKGEDGTWLQKVWRRIHPSEDATPSKSGLEPAPAIIITVYDKGDDGEGRICQVFTRNISDSGHPGGASKHSNYPTSSSAARLHALVSMQSTTKHARDEREPTPPPAAPPPPPPPTPLNPSRPLACHPKLAKPHPLSPTAEEESGSLSGHRSREDRSAPRPSGDGSTSLSRAQYHQPRPRSPLSAASSSSRGFNALRTGSTTHSRNPITPVKPAEPPSRGTSPYPKHAPTRTHSSNAPASPKSSRAAEPASASHPTSHLHPTSLSHSPALSRQRSKQRGDTTLVPIPPPVLSGVDEEGGFSTTTTAVSTGRSARQLDERRRKVAPKTSRTLTFPPVGVGKRNWGFSTDDVDSDGSSPTTLSRPLPVQSHQGSSYARSASTNNRSRPARGARGGRNESLDPSRLSQLPMRPSDIVSAWLSNHVEGPVAKPNSLSDPRNRVLRTMAPSTDADLSPVEEFPVQIARSTQHAGQGDRASASAPRQQAHEGSASAPRQQAHEGSVSAPRQQVHEGSASAPRQRVHEGSVSAPRQRVQGVMAVVAVDAGSESDGSSASSPAAINSEGRKVQRLAVQKGAVQQQAVCKQTVQQQAVQKQTVPQQAVHQKAVQQQAVQQQAVQQQAGSKAQAKHHQNTTERPRDVSKAQQEQQKDTTLVRDQTRDKTSTEERAHTSSFHRNVARWLTSRRKDSVSKETDARSSSSTIPKDEQSSSSHMSDRVNPEELEMGSGITAGAVSAKGAAESARAHIAAGAHVTSESARCHVMSESARGHMTSESAGGHVTSESTRGCVASESATAHGTAETAGRDTSTQFSAVNARAESAGGSITPETSSQEVGVSGVRDSTQSLLSTIQPGQSYSGSGRHGSSPMKYDNIRVNPLNPLATGDSVAMQLATGSSTLDSSKQAGSPASLRRAVMAAVPGRAKLTAVERSPSSTSTASSSVSVKSPLAKETVVAAEE